jgi:hypothetical protein
VPHGKLLVRFLDLLLTCARTDAENALVYQQEICKEEIDIEQAVKEALKKK